MATRWFSAPVLWDVPHSYFTRQLFTNVPFATWCIRCARRRVRARGDPVDRRCVSFRAVADARRVATPTTSCRTRSFARTDRGTPTCRAATAGGGSSRSAGTSSSGHASARVRRWISRRPRWTPRSPARSTSAALRARRRRALAARPGAGHRRRARQVPEPFRSTLIIVDVEDQSYESAAEILGVPIGTVRSRLFRGRRLMQEQLLSYAIDAGLRAR